MAAYAEVATRSNFSLLDGASHPAELVATAARLGHAGIGLCDTNTLAGVVWDHVAAKELRLRFASALGSCCRTAANTWLGRPAAPAMAG